MDRGWNRRVKSSVLQVLSLAHYCFSTVRGRGPGAGREVLAAGAPSPSIAETPSGSGDAGPARSVPRPRLSGTGGVDRGRVKGPGHRDHPPTSEHRRDLFPWLRSCRGRPFRSPPSVVGPGASFPAREGADGAVSVRSRGKDHGDDLPLLPDQSSARARLSGTVSPGARLRGRVEGPGRRDRPPTSIAEPPSGSGPAGPAGEIMTMICPPLPPPFPRTAATLLERRLGCGGGWEVPGRPDHSHRPSPRPLPAPGVPGPPLATWPLSSARGSLAGGRRSGTGAIIIMMIRADARPGHCGPSARPAAIVEGRWMALRAAIRPFWAGQPRWTSTASIRRYGSTSVPRSRQRRRDGSIQAGPNRRSARVRSPRSGLSSSSARRSR